MHRLRNDLSKVKRLINITRPVDLPPLQLKQNIENKPDEMKKKPALPLFGKKRTFGLGKSAILSTILPQSTTTTKTVSQCTKATADDSQDFMEEFDEDDETEMKTKRIAEEQNKKPTTSSSQASNMQSPSMVEVEQPQCDTSAISSIKSKEISQKPVKSVVVVEEEEEKVSSSISKSVENAKPDELMNTTVDSTTAEASKGGSKKKRNRNRDRDDKLRDNIDIDDAEEAMDTEKYAGWIPPENQAGDGITDLNSKYGY